MTTNKQILISLKNIFYDLYFTGWAMSQNLPVRRFRWLTSETIEKQFPIKNIKNVLHAINVDSRTGYVLEVELKYPSKLHDDHSDYPLAPENIKIDSSMFSPFMMDYFHTSDTTKLTPNLTDKERYTVHYRNLQLYIDLGMQVTKV